MTAWRFSRVLRSHALGRYAQGIVTPSPALVTQVSPLVRRALSGAHPKFPAASAAGNVRGFVLPPPVRQPEQEMQNGFDEAENEERVAMYKELMKRLASRELPRRSAIQEFIKTASTKEDVRQSVILVDKYKQHQFEFNKYTGSFLLHACIRAKHFEAALTILKSWRQLRVHFTARAGQRLLAAMASEGQLDMVLSAHSLLLKAVNNYDNKQTQLVLIKCLALGEEKRLADAFREFESSRLRGVKGHILSYKLLVQAINNEMQAGGDVEALDGMRSKVKTMLKEDGLGSPPPDDLVQLLVFTPSAQPPPAEEDKAEAAEEGKSEGATADGGGATKAEAGTPRA